MMSMEEMQTLLKGLRMMYSDVRLLDVDAVNEIKAGAQALPNDDTCYTC